MSQLARRLLALVIATAALVPAPTVGAAREPAAPVDEPPPVQVEPPLPPGDHPVVVHDCDVAGGYRVGERRSPVAASASFEVHELDIYQTRGDHSYGYHPLGAADLYVHRRDRPVVLVLSAYEPTEWRIHPDPGAEIALIVVDGYHEQTVSGVTDGTAVVSRANWAQLVDEELAALADAPASSSTSCYDASLFSLRPDRTGGKTRAAG